MVSSAARSIHSVWILLRASKSKRETSVFDDRWSIRSFASLKWITASVMCPGCCRKLSQPMFLFHECSTLSRLSKRFWQISHQVRPNQERACSCLTHKTLFYELVKNFYGYRACAILFLP